MFLPKDTTCLAEPGFMATSAASGRILQRMRSYGPGPGDTVVADLLSNSAFLGTDSDGMPLQQFKGGGWGLPCTRIPYCCTSLGDKKKALYSAVPIADPAMGAAFILVAPTPRYVTRKCCVNPTHIDNFGKKNYESDIMEGIDQHIQSINNWAAEKGLDYYILDPISSGGSP
jgi:hypothetical protein